MPPAPEGEKKPPTMILAAAGGVAGIVLIVILLMVATKGCGSYPTPGASAKLTDTPEKAGESYVKFKEEESWLELKVKLDRDTEKLDFYKGFGDWMEDKADWNDKVLKKQENYIKKFKESEGDLEKFVLEDVKCDDEKVGDKPTGRKLYSCNAKGKKLSESGDTDWKVEEEKRPHNFTLAKIRGKWVIVR